MLEPCNKEVFDKGVSLGFVDMTKEQAEAHCKAETERTGNLYDWHYVGGRVHIMMLEKVKMPAAFISEVELQYHNITLLQEEIEILGQFKNGLINVTELCNKLGGYGLQVVKIGADDVTLCRNVGEDENCEIIISFKVAL